MKILINEQVVRQALECLEGVATGDYCGNAESHAATLRSALEAVEKVEPVAWRIITTYDTCFPRSKFDVVCLSAEQRDYYLRGATGNVTVTPLYTHPTQKVVSEYPLHGYVNAAEINANDLPHVVVEKLEKAILAAAPTSRPEYGGEYGNFHNKVEPLNWFKEGCPNCGIPLKYNRGNNEWPIDALNAAQTPLTIQEFGKEIRQSRESAIAFLQRAGILDENGDLAEHYKNE